MADEAKEKKKPLTYDKAVEKLKATKEELKTKREEFQSFLKDKKLSKSEDHSAHKDEKIAKKFKRFKSEIEELQKKRDELDAFCKENKPKKERETKYNYPEGADADVKKKFRQNCRAKAKAAGVDLAEYLSDPAKYDAAVAIKKEEKEKKKAEKESKKEKKAEKSESSDKPEKKKKKPKVQEEDED